MTTYAAIQAPSFPSVNTLPERTPPLCIPHGAVIVHVTQSTTAYDVHWRPIVYQVVAGCPRAPKARSPRAAGLGALHQKIFGKLIAGNMWLHEENGSRTLIIETVLKVITVWKNKKQFPKESQNHNYPTFTHINRRSFPTRAVLSDNKCFWGDVPPAPSLRLVRLWSQVKSSLLYNQGPGGLWHAAYLIR